MARSSIGKPFSLEVVAALLAEILLHEGQRLDEIATSEAEPFDEWMKGVMTRDRGLNKRLASAFVSSLRRRRDKRRRWITCETRAAAEEAEARGILAARQARRAFVDPAVTVRQYADHWLRVAALKPRSRQLYETNLRLYILPAIGDRPLCDVDRGILRSLLASKLAGEEALAASTVKTLHATLSSLLSSAREDGILLANPAAGLCRALKLRARAAWNATDEGERKALDADELRAFLSVAREREADFYPALLVAALAGLRLGELCGLRREDLDLKAGVIRVRRQVLYSGEVASPKAGRPRDVDMAAPIRRLLGELPSQPRPRVVSMAGVELSPAEASERGPWLLFPGLPAVPTHRHYVNVMARFRRAMTRAAKAAGIGRPLSPHALRHTFASLLLQDGVSPAYVQEQLGHATIELTVGVYGRWLRKRSPGAVDRLAERAGELLPGPLGSRMVATGAHGSPELEPPQGLAAGAEYNLC